MDGDHLEGAPSGLELRQHRRSKTQRRQRPESPDHLHEAPVGSRHQAGHDRSPGGHEDEDGQVGKVRVHDTVLEST